MTDQSRQPGILFTAFEPSGDALAASVIARLRDELPGVPIVGWGGPMMRAAGAEIIEDTCRDADMIIPALALVRKHLAIGKRVKRLAAAGGIAVHVPVDSPAANFPLCKTTRRHSCRVVHLVAPQLWAWLEGRVRKLRRRTDLVLCLLPFEEQWFRDRNVPAKYIGHPLFDQAEPVVEADSTSLQDGSPRLVILPGSRMSEIDGNFPLMLASLDNLQAKHPDLAAVAVAANDGVAERLHDLARPGHKSLRIVVGSLDVALRWSDLALVVSGTVTLQVARARRPMIVMYHVKRGLVWLLFHTLGRLVVKTRLYALPNVLAGHAIVPEFAPHVGGHEPITEEVARHLADPSLGESQVTALREVLAPFQDRCASALAADEIARVYRAAVG
ncbi:MAG: hypothetical protein KAS72_10545 [Phycisphaerales bacterium]|nr:hypothetical protein [Phycisphaerales bacterium]